jgi:predicted transcriptional regulator of viral defense system
VILEMLARQQSQIVHVGDRHPQLGRSRRRVAQEHGAHHHQQAENRLNERFFLSPIIRKSIALSSCFAYDWGMASLDGYLDQQLERGRAYFSREEALPALGLAPQSFAAAVSRLIRKRRLANPRHGFYLILRPEDRALGAPDPVRWIDPLMEHQGIEYRISLLRAAAFHGSSHQAAMVFQLVVPKQLRGFEIGRHRLQFIYQASHAFAVANRPEWLAQMKSEAGFAKVAGVELTLLDCARYLHRAAGINGVAQIAKDLGGKADPRKLARLADAYENSSVRRLGYLLELARHVRQAKALEPFAREAKSLKPLDPAAKPLVASLASLQEKNPKWMLLINERVEVEA